MKFSNWLKYFRANQDHFDHLDWTIIPPLTLPEKDLINSSIRQFQRGEHSEGKHFLSFANSLHDQSYLDTVKIFIKEEQDHAFILGRFMDSQDIKRIKSDWLDNVFRGLRKLAGLEGTVTVLLTAEIISMIYYQALMKATSSCLLKRICRQILTDEEMHLRFQCHTLFVIYGKKKYWGVILSRIIHTILMCGTIMIVWWFHKKVLKAGGYKFFSFFNSVWKEFSHCSKMIRESHQGIAEINPDNQIRKYENEQVILP